MIPPTRVRFDNELVSKKVHVRRRDLVLVKALVEAAEGLVFVTAARDGELTFSSPLDRRQELEEFLLDLQAFLASRQPADEDS